MKISHVVKLYFFVSVLILLLTFSSILFREKQTNNRLKESTTDWINEFYELPENSLDLLFLGTSHSFCSFDPNQLWNETGITAYNLSSSAQDMNATLLYLKEALKVQQPKVVFVEMRGALFTDGTEEQWNRLAYDNMPMSFDKLDAIIKSKADEESLLSYIFPVFRYHQRWKALNSDDFQYTIEGNDNNHYSLNGFFMRQKVTPVTFEHFYDEPPKEWNGISDNVKENLLEIQKICAERNIHLVLWKAPTPMWREYYQDAINEFASQNGLFFLDLNENMSEIGLDFQKDFLDANSHLNFSGAKKVTSYITNWILDRYEFNNKKLLNNELYQNWNLNYQYYLKSILLTSNYSIEEYLTSISRPEYTVFFAVNDGTSKVPENLKSFFKEFGFTSQFENCDTHSFLAVMHSGNIIYEKMSSEALNYRIDSEAFCVEMESKGWLVGDDASIKLDQQEYLLANQRGLGIVVYDNILEQVIDSVTFDIREDCKCYRNTNLN